MSGIAWEDPKGPPDDAPPQRRIFNCPHSAFLRALGEPAQVWVHWVPTPGGGPRDGKTVPHLTSGCRQCAIGNEQTTLRGYVPALLWTPGPAPNWKEEVIWYIPGINLPDLGDGIRGIVFESKRNPPRSQRPLTIKRLENQAKYPPLTVAAFDVKLHLARIWGVAGRQVMPLDETSIERTRRLQFEEQIKRDQEEARRKERGLFDGPIAEGQ